MQKKDYISDIHVFKETKDQFVLGRNNTPNFVETNGQSLPIVALWLGSQKSITAQVQFLDANPQRPCLFEAFQHARISKPPTTVNSKVSIEVSIKPLRAFIDETRFASRKFKEISRLRTTGSCKRLSIEHLEDKVT